MEEHFGIASFRSRQQVMAFEHALRQSGVKADIVNTPRAVAAGCGLSVRFDLRDERAALEVYRATRPGNLIGFYRATRREDGRLMVQPMGWSSGYTG
ncbi:MAG: DUF3343 domain-containing protein [Aristaeellaceae bacterium]